MNDKLKTLSKSILRIVGRTVRDAAISIAMDAIARRTGAGKDENLNSDYYKRVLGQAAITNSTEELKQGFERTNDKPFNEFPKGVPENIFGSPEPKLKFGSQIEPVRPIIKRDPLPFDIDSPEYQNIKNEHARIFSKGELRHLVVVYDDNGKERIVDKGPMSEEDKFCKGFYPSFSKSRPVVRLGEDGKFHGDPEVVASLHPMFPLVDGYKAIVLDKDGKPMDYWNDGTPIMRGSVADNIYIDDAGFLPKEEIVKQDNSFDLWNDPDAVLSRGTSKPIHMPLDPHEFVAPVEIDTSRIANSIARIEGAVPAVDIDKLKENISVAVENAVEGSTEVEVEIPYVVPVNPSFVPRTKEQIWEDAKKAVAEMDASEGLADLDGNVGRVEVDAKRMINCRADLNQLIPFKYGFAWQAYLKATERHWTFQEIKLENDVKDWNDSSIAQSKVIVGAIYSLELNSVFLNNDAVLNIYRFITNPEARQYLLRQRAELSVWGNFVHSVMDTYCEQLPNTEAGEPRYSFNDKAYRSFFNQTQVADRQVKRRQIQIRVGNPLLMQHETNDIAERWEVVCCMVLQYLVFGFVYNYTSLIQLLALGREGKYVNLAEGAENILRDLVLQTEFSILCINKILEENADILTEQNITSLRDQVFEHVKTETEYMDWYANTSFQDCRSEDQIKTLHFMVDLYLSSINLGTLYTESKPAVVWFTELYQSFLPDLHSGGNTVLSASGTGGSLEW